MTIALQPAPPGSSPGVTSVEPVRRARSLRRWLADHPAWPIAAMLGGWPLWWLLGFNEYAPVLFAVPMVARMYRWRATGTRRIRIPPGLLVWLLFLVVTVGGVAELRQQAPETILSSTANEAFSWGIRTLSYIASTVVLLYAGNLTESELPRRRLAWLLGLTGCRHAAPEYQAHLTDGPPRPDEHPG